MEDARCHRWENGHPGPKRAVALMHVHGANSSDDIWREAGEAQNVKAGLEHSMVRSRQKVRGEKELTVGEGRCGDLITPCCVSISGTVRALSFLYDLSYELFHKLEIMNDSSHIQTHPAVLAFYSFAENK